MDFYRERRTACGLSNGDQAFFLSEKAVSIRSRVATSGTCGLWSVRDFPILAIRAIANASMVIFAVMQESWRPFIPRALRMRKAFNIAVKSKAKQVPNIQILPVYVLGTSRQSTIDRRKMAPAQMRSKRLTAVLRAHVSARRKLPFRRVYRSILRRWLFQNRATCPWKARPLQWLEICERRLCRAMHAASGSRGARLRGFR